MKVKLSDKQILNYKNDGVILIKKVFLPWIEKLKTGFHKVLSNPSSYGRENISNSGYLQLFINDIRITRIYSDWGTRTSTFF